MYPIILPKLIMRFLILPQKTVPVMNVELNFRFISYRKAMCMRFGSIILDSTKFNLSTYTFVVQIIMQYSKVGSPFSAKLFSSVSCEAVFSV